MEQSPLSRQARPENFQPKVVTLYEELFGVEAHSEHAQGFWQEFFLLKPDFASLRRILDALSPDSLLLHQVSTQQLFSNAINTFKKGVGPADEIALDTLSVFLENVLNKRYTSPNSDIITVLASLHEVDNILTGFVESLNSTIRNGRTAQVRQKAVRTALAGVSGAYRTGLVSYFIARDLFPSLMKFVQEGDDATPLNEAFTLLTLLVNYNKFEFQNPYQHRLADFINESAIKKAVVGMGAAFVTSRDSYVAIQNDQTEGWTLGGTLSYFGIGGRASNTQNAVTLTAEEQKTAFAALPPPEAAVVLSTYDFVNANKLFCLKFVAPTESKSSTASSFSSFLSCTSYMVQHAHRTARSAVYTCLNVLILRVLLEDGAVAKALCDTENKMAVRICRQRQPFLPIVKGVRVPILHILDVIVDGITHNLQRRLDVDLYHLFFNVLLRVITFLSHSRIRLVYHWAELWRSLLSFVRFLDTYSNDLKFISGMDDLNDTMVTVLALALSKGELFLPDAASYDDLFYKVFESGDAIKKLRDNFSLLERGSAAAMGVLLNVADHFQKLLQEQKGNGGRGLGPQEVSRLIKQGYETLAIQTKEGIDRWDKYREGDYRNLLKKLIRVAVEDSRAILT